MSKNYYKRYLKLLPHRAKNKAKPHTIPILIAVFSVFSLIYLFTKIPPISKPTTQPVSKFTKVLDSPPDMSAKNIFIQDVNTGEVLYQKDADQAIYPASTTKIATALVVFDEYNLSQVFEIKKSYPDGQGLGLSPGQKFLGLDLLNAMLVYSANDAAESLADNDPDGREAFMAKMNALSERYLLHNTHFKNPTGLDEEGHYSSAADLARLAGVAMKNQLFRRIVSSENVVVKTIDGKDSYSVQNTNQLLGKISGVVGIKTGFTEKAGESVITEYSQNGTTFIIAIFGSNDRFGDTQKAINWILSR